MALYQYTLRRLALTFPLLIGVTLVAFVISHAVPADPVTANLGQKAMSDPEIVAAFRTMELGDPAAFYDAIITAGFPLRRGEVGTLGELSPKPHPWLYAETARIGLGIPFAERNSVLGIEDSGAGVCAIRLAGFPTVGLAGGNIIESGTRALCDFYCGSLAEVLSLLE